MNTLEKVTVIGLLAGSGFIFGSKAIDKRSLKNHTKGLGYGIVLVASTLNPYLIRKQKKYQINLDKQEGDK